MAPGFCKLTSAIIIRSLNLLFSALGRLGAYIRYYLEKLAKKSDPISGSRPSESLHLLLIAGL